MDIPILEEDSQTKVVQSDNFRGIVSKPKALNLGPRDGGTRIQRSGGDGGQCNCSSVIGYRCSYTKWVKKNKWFQSEPCDFLSPLAYINQDFCQFKEIKTQLKPT